MNDSVNHSILRENLIAQKPHDGLIKNIVAMAEKILSVIDAKEDCSQTIDEICQATGLLDLDEDYFRTLYTHSSVEDFANMAALPRAKYVPDLNRDELIEITKRAMNTTSWDSEYYMELLDKNVSLSGASNLIFYPPDSYQGDISDYNPTAEEIVDLATAEDNVIKL